MSEKKRFELRSYGNDDLWEMKDRQGESLLTWGDIEKKLNQLAEENEKLKKERRKDAKEFSALFKQNYGLKRENEKLKKKLDYFQKRTIDLREQLDYAKDEKYEK